MKYFVGDIQTLKDNGVFVFGSNPQGWHGAGTAKIALDNFGAVKGNGRGIQGQSYALVTKNLKAGWKEKSTGIVYEKEGFQSVSAKQIVDNLKELYDFARSNPNKDFFIAYKNDSHNLNGYTSKEMLDFFIEAAEGKHLPNNIAISNTFKDLYREKTAHYEENPSGVKSKSPQKAESTKPEVALDFKITVVNIGKDKGVKNDSNYVYCGRGSALGNPEPMVEYTQEERDRVCEVYIDHFEKSMKQGRQDMKDQLNLIWKTGQKHGEVKIGCYCAPLRCHCDTIKETLENKQRELKAKREAKVSEKSSSPTPGTQI